MCRVFTLLALAILVALLACSSISPAPAAAADSVVLTPPVDAPIVDPFRLPDGPYGAGNRGIEYGTEAGQRVVAAAGGTVVFAGPVAGSLHVTVDHGGGLVSSYSFLERLLVGRGDIVARGERVGVAGPTFHLGVRLFGEYIDPAPLMGRMVVRVRLVAGTGSTGRVVPPAVASAAFRAVTRSADGDRAARAPAATVGYLPLLPAAGGLGDGRVGPAARIVDRP